MGRHPHTHTNLPPYMRKRVRNYGTYYFLDTGEKPRREIPLGKDYVVALRRYAELPKKSANTVRVLTTDLNYLEAYFGDAPMDEIRPMHIRMFLDKHSDKPTTANRCKRVFSAVWNVARGWGYTDLATPTAGIMGYALNKREVYITDEVFKAVRDQASASFKDAMDLAYLTGQRPSDTLHMTEDDIIEGYLVVTQSKTHKKLCIVVTGQLADLLGRIAVRKAQSKIEHRNLLMNLHGDPLTAQVLRNHFKAAKGAAIAANPKLEHAIKEFWFYDLRAKAADDVGDERGAQAATDLLGHDSQRTTSRHYRRRGIIVEPTR